MTRIDNAYREGYRQGFNGFPFPTLPYRLYDREKSKEAFRMGVEDGRGDKRRIDYDLGYKVGD